MIILNKYNPVFITGAERSGSTIIAKILDLCGIWSGNCNNMFENKAFTELNNEFLNQYDLSMPSTSSLVIPVYWKDGVERILKNEDGLNKPWMIKHSGLARLWPIWDFTYPDAKWLIIRRKTGDVVQSCVKTGYMKLFKNSSNFSKFNFKTEEEGWLWWIHQYENKFIEMIQTGLNCRIIWPDRMVTGDYSQIYETVLWLGLKWNNRIPEIIDPLLNKSREVENENKCG